jgi:hypothetical protein
VESSNIETGEIASVTLGKPSVNEFQNFRHVTVIISKHVAQHAMRIEDMGFCIP